MSDVLNIVERYNERNGYMSSGNSSMKSSMNSFLHFRLFITLRVILSISRGKMPFPAEL
jgi:hypothetical protein